MDHFKHLKIMPGTIDSHCHLTVCRSKQLPVDEILAACVTCGMSYLLDIGIRPGDLDERRKLTGSLPAVLFAVGVHPAEAEAYDNHIVSTQLSEAKVVAVGETGLDWYRGRDSADAQYASFEAQLELARAYDLPVIIHNRDATEDIYRVLKRVIPPRGGVMHCYGAGAEWVDRFVDLGFAISFAGNITFRKADDLRTAAARVPVQWLLAETDAPFLAPEPARGRPNHPGYLLHTYRMLAKIRAIAVEELIESLASNFGRMFLPRG